MQKLGLRQSLLQKLTPQQIQFIKLLQIPTTSLETRIEQELEENPLLEALQDSPSTETTAEENENADSFEDNNNDESELKSKEDDEIDLGDYLRDDDISGYKMQGDGNYPEEEEREAMPIPVQQTFQDSLTNQLGFLRLNEKDNKIAEQLLGSIEEDGYIRRPLSSIADDLAFSQNITITVEEIEKVLTKIQEFEPAGIAARNLRECLLLQLKRKVEEESVLNALKIIESYFDEFTKKHYEKIQKNLSISDELLKESLTQITHLNPKPGDSGSSNRFQTIIPDFILINNDGKLEIHLNSKNAPVLRISNAYSDLLDTYRKSDKKDKKMKEAVFFVKQKLDAAKWFIDAINQRQQTLMKTMHAIVDYQREYFQEGDETKLRPMILKNIADIIKMDISTVSRVVNSKFVQTDFGIIPLKYFFSEGISTDEGEDASSREVKSILGQLIADEDKKKPLPDDELAKLLNQKGYNIARRTIAKYREKLNIPVARLRKEM